MEFIFEDDQFLPRLSVQATRKLISLDIVNSLVIGDTTTARAVIAAVPDNIPIYAWASEHEDFIRKNVVRAWPRKGKEGRATGQEIIDRNLSSIAILASSHDYTLSWARDLKGRIGDRIIEYEEFSPDPEDFRSLLLKFKRKGIRAVGLCLNNPKNGQVAREAASLRLVFSFFGCNFLQAASDQRVAGGALRGGWYLDTAVTTDFKERYLKLAGTTDYLNAAAVMHDMAYVLMEADTRKLELDQLENLNPVEGANGRFLVRNDAGRYFDFEFTSYVIE